MPSGVTETWRGKGKRRGSNQSDTAKRIFTVVGAPDEDTAMDDVFTFFGVEVNSAYDSSDPDNLLFCSEVDADYESPSVYKVTATFQIPPLGYFQVSDDPLDLPWTFDWKTVVETMPFDRDIDGNPVVNSSLDAYTGNPTRTITYKVLKIVRNESFYDYVTYKQYENCVNSDSITLVEPNGETNTFAAGTIKCVSIEPTRAYTANDTFVPICITLEIYDATQLTTTHPFQLHILDQGSRGYWGSGTPKTSGNIVHQDPDSGLYQVVACDVRLNGLGKPLDTTLKIGTSGQTPVALSASPAGATVEPFGTAPFDAVYLMYKRYKAIALLPLLDP
jgi:hypothetical protein